MSAPQPAPPGHVLRIANVASTRVHVCGAATMMSLCGVVCDAYPPPPYALRWGSSCPRCAKVLAGVGTQSQPGATK